MITQCKGIVVKLCICTRIKVSHSNNKQLIATERGWKYILSVLLTKHCLHNDAQLIFKRVSRYTCKVSFVCIFGFLMFVHTSSGIIQNILLQQQNALH